MRSPVSPGISASIVVNNYNYGAFLAEAIDSALAQTWEHTEVVVVDDGSTDDSADIINGYGDRIVPVLKANGGQGSAFNAGYAASAGDVVIFLDADDRLRPTAVEAAVPHFTDPSTATVQWRLTVINAEGRTTPQLIPRRRPPVGDLRRDAVERGPDQFRWAPTSGTAWSRRYLERVLPAPELYRHGIDCYLFQLVPYFGKAAALESSESFYRLHGANDSRTIGFDRKLRRQIRFYDDYSARALAECTRRGWVADPAQWRANSWWCRLDRAASELDATLEPGAPFILVDENSWGVDETFSRRPVMRFVDRDGRYWGPPADDASAVAELERLRQAGASAVAFAWKSFWMLDHYQGLAAHLHDNHTVRLDNDRLKIFSLDRRIGGASR